MKKIISFELERGLRSRTLWISLFISMSFVVLDLLFFCHENKVWSTEGVITPMIEAWLGTDYKFAFNQLFFVLLPILASLPFGASYFEDVQSGYIKNICLKGSRAGYFAAKCIAVFVTGWLAIFIPLCASIILCMTFYPERRPEKLLFLTAAVWDTSLMAEIYNTKPLLYAVIYTLIDAMFGGMLAVCSVCISEHVASRFSAVVTPFTFYILTGVLLIRYDKTWSLYQMLNPQQDCPADAFRLLLIYAVLLTMGIFWIRLQGKRKEILE
ncbi:MAG: hypothetical protein NC347_04485 [Clostridium sp.]|nr:hypothetical protein [Clostridium sp.]